MSRATRATWPKPPKPPGEMRDGAYVIPTRSKFFTPWTIRARVPRRRDFWRVLLGRWEPTLYVTHGLTLAGFDRGLKATWTAPRLERQLHEGAPLLRELGRAE